MAVYTDQITSELEGRDIDEPLHDFGVVRPGQSDYQHDAAAALVSDNVRYWFHKVCQCPPNAICDHNNLYFYKFGSHVYVSFRERSIDRTAATPTIYENKVTLDLVEDPGSLIDVLNSRPPAVKGILF
jgi:fibrillarin-like rRNA methylase